MGSSASVSQSHSAKRRSIYGSIMKRSSCPEESTRLPPIMENEVEKKECRIDNFVKEVYQSISCFESLDNVILYKSGEEALLQFLKQEYCEENLQFYLDVQTAKMIATGDVSKLDTKHLFDKYLSTESPSEVNISSSLKTRITTLIDVKNGCGAVEPSEIKHQELFQSLESAQAEVKAVLALGALPRFFVSPIFAEWREAQAAAGTLILFRATSGLGPPKIENTVNPVEDILLGQLDTMLGCNQWLRALLSSLENIPVCVSVAAASSASRGFPLIYVNKSFERATGYQRSEVLGKNCKFLQTGKHGEAAEPESIAKLTAALSAKEAIKITITNFRKDGTPFRNLLAVKPIFDEKGEYAFVVGMQFDTGQEDATPEKLKLLDTFFSLLPATVINGPDADIPILREAVFVSQSGRIKFGVEPASPKTCARNCTALIPIPMESFPMEPMSPEPEPMLPIPELMLPDPELLSPKLNQIDLLTPKPTPMEPMSPKPIALKPTPIELMSPKPSSPKPTPPESESSPPKTFIISQ